MASTIVSRRRTESGDSQGEAVCFASGGQDFAVGVAHVHEIIRLVAITPIPDAPDSILGVINLRGSVIPVVDLQAKLGMGSASLTINTPIMVVSVSGKQVGLIVDEVREVCPLDEADMQDIPDTISGLPYLEAVAKVAGRLIHFLNLEKLLTVSEVIVDRRRAGRPWGRPAESAEQTEETAATALDSA